jgi:predicted ATPase
MIKTLRLENFKAFKDTGDIELKPITVLAGPNSGGKSSILQSLLLLRQTLETETPEIDLNLNGRFLQFSGLDELTFRKPLLQNCEINYHFELETRIPADAIPRYCPDLDIPESNASLPLQSDVEFSFRYREVEEDKGRVVLDRFDMNACVQNAPGPRLTFAFRNGGYQVEQKGVDLPELYRDRKIQGALGRHFLPNLLILEPDTEEDKERSPIIQLDPIFLSPLRNLEAELKNNLRYLGPLREEPQRAYLHSGSPYPEIGKRGEYAAQMLWLERDDKVQYLPTLGQEIEETKLLNAVSDVFGRLGIIEPIDVKSEQTIMYQILFRLVGSKKQVTIADVGFGVSQLLPIVVMGLRSPQASLLLFEQPEIHLHPKLQANLADFFLTLAMSGKRLLIETHSDHFINRLRRRIAEDPTDELREQVSMLFVRPPHDGQGAIIEPLQVDRYGVIENWPSDFLPESADEAQAIFQAGLEKRREQR